MDWRIILVFVTIMGLATGNLTSKIGTPYLLAGYFLGVLIGMFTMIALQSEVDKRRVQAMKKYKEALVVA